MPQRRAVERIPIVQAALLALSLAMAIVGCDGTSEQLPPTPSVTQSAQTVVEPASTEPAPTETEVAPEPEPPVTATAEMVESEETEAATEVASTATATATAIPSIVESQVSEVSLAPIAGGFTAPIYLTHAGDERLFVVEQAGLIKIIDDGGTLAQPFLNITSRVGSTALEQGLLSVAFHPDYQNNGRFFVDYTDLLGDTVVAEYHVDASDANLADPASERILLTVDQPYGNHNGGQLQFGPDGYLYVGMGDGGSAGDPLNQGQDPGTLLGTLLRLDVDAEDLATDLPYGIPPDNPFAGSDAGRDEVWAYGLRNPWRFSFDKENGDLYLADVGQNLWEEVNFQGAGAGAGANYGWSIMEATSCFVATSCDSSGLVLPVAEYSHLDGNCSVSGGYVYRGSAFPALQGNYFYADYCSGTIWSLFNGADGWQTLQLQRTGMFIPSFGEGWDGELYIMDRINGDIYQLQS